LCFGLDEDDVTSARFQADPRLQGYEGILHGGMIAALLDSAMTHCLFHQGVRAVTGDLRVRFKRPISCRAELVIRAWILTSRPPLYRLRAEICNEGSVMAWGEAKFLRQDRGGWK
jgi:acyl-coenzyme A thioesterase PaaI-like protein